MHFSVGWEPLTTAVNMDMVSDVQCGACHWKSKERVQLPECLGQMISPFCAHFSLSLLWALLEADTGHTFAVLLAQWGVDLSCHCSNASNEQ